MNLAHLLQLLSAAFALIAAFGGACATAVVADAGGAPAGGAAPLPTDAADPGATGDPAGAVEPTDEAAAAAAGGGTDDSDDDLPDDTDVADHLPESNLRTRLRRTQRFLARTGRPLLERLRKPGGGYYTPEELEQVLSHAKQFSDVDAVLSKSKRAVQVLLEEQQRLSTGDVSPAAEERDTPFDEAAWPFETETKEGKALLQLAKNNHEMQGLVRRLEKQLTGTTKERQQERLETLNGQWKDATLKAAEEVDPPYRALFIRNVKREFELLHARGQLTKANAKDIIDRELAEVRAAKKTTTRQTTARQSAAVAGNAVLPRAVRPGAVTPAAAGSTGKRETLKDASVGFLSKYRG